MIKAWLKFFRVVNLPTVPGDVWVGAVAAWFGEGIVFDYGVPLFTATVASVFLYLFGLADNDIVGAKTDKGRPIPDGQISMRAARIARAACALAAIGAGLAPDPIAGTPLPGAWWPVAFTLLCAIVAYNRTKAWALMGLCRGLNVVCGGVVVLSSCASLTSGEGAASPLLSLGVCVAVWTVYFAAVTKYSEGEEMDEAKRRRVGFLVGAIIYLQILALLVFQSGIVVLLAVALLVMRLMKWFLPEVDAS